MSTTREKLLHAVTRYKAGGSSLSGLVYEIEYLVLGELGEERFSDIFDQYAALAEIDADSADRNYLLTANERANVENLADQIIAKFD
jgi:hypothetical protein